MAEKTGIQWADHTVNFWWGCMKVSPGCANCYAEVWSKRYGRAIWGPAATTARWRTKGPWRDILRWDARAAADGVRRRVFAQSMSDFFEEHPQLDEWRAEACEILAGLKHLDVQLLTKRPENIRRMVPDEWLTAWPSHIWIGTSVENQEQANKRIRHLLGVPAAIHFLSCEPLLGLVDLPYRMEWSSDEDWANNGPPHVTLGISEEPDSQIGWVIVGGESGPKARPMRPAWARSLRDQCQAAGVPFFMKQNGEFLDGVRVGKKRAGRLLDGREWNEFPQTPSA